MNNVDKQYFEFINYILKNGVKKIRQDRNWNNFCI